MRTQCTTCTQTQALRENPNCVLATTPCGGHLGWVSGKGGPLEAPWSNEVRSTTRAMECNVGKRWAHTKMAAGPIVLAVEGKEMMRDARARRQTIAGCENALQHPSKIPNVQARKHIMPLPECCCTASSDYRPCKPGMRDMIAEISALLQCLSAFSARGLIRTSSATKACSS
eukprot:scaffold78755_cov20-Tisochrysis_lutea.AAC.1